MIKNIQETIIEILVGGWDSSLQILLIVMSLDYLTGVAGAFKSKAVNSSIGYKGIFKKASIFIVVILAAQLDRMVGITNDLFRNCTALFFTINDALSVLENIGGLGVKLPSFLHAALVKLQDQNNEKGNSIDECLASQHLSEKYNNDNSNSNND